MSEWRLDGRVVEWRGPAPYVFVELPREASEEIREAGRELVYWGQVPVSAVIGGTGFATALFPREGLYLLPLRIAVRRAEGIAEGDRVTVDLDLRR